MTDRFASSEAHGYVDSCLDPQQKRAFEARLHEESELRRRVETWQAQNEAIRLAFGASPRTRFSLGRPSNENATARLNAETDLRRVESSPAPRKAGSGETSQAARPVAEAPPPALGMLRWAAVGALAFGLLCVSASGGPADPRDALMDAGASSLRAFSAAAVAPLDMPTHDARALAKWLSPRFALNPPLSGLEIPGWSLVGARMVPGTRSAAALILFENEDHVRAGLMIEPLDAPPALAPLARRIGAVASAAATEGGHGIAAMGPSVSVVAALMRGRGAGGD